MDWEIPATWQARHGWHGQVAGTMECGKNFKKILRKSGKKFVLLHII